MRRRRPCTFATDAAGQQANLDAAILGATRPRGIVGDRADFAKAENAHAEQRNVVLFGKVTLYGIGALLRQLVVVLVTAGRIGEAFDFEDKVRAVFDL